MKKKTNNILAVILIILGIVMLFPIYILFMVRFMINNSIAPINLLQQNDAHKLMRKCHFGKTECIVGTP